MSTNNVPEEFIKVMKDFISDIKTTFPEFDSMIQKWWKPENGEEAQEKSMKFLFKFCQKKYPPQFFNILYQNEEIFTENTKEDTEFLPFIHFKDVWQFDISASTKETIWKYLKLLSFSIISSLDDKEAFGDTARLFEAINNDDFKSKIEETMNQLFENMTPETRASTEEGFSKEDLPSVDEIHQKINEMMGGKLGALAHEIAQETSQNLNINFGPDADMKDVFNKLIKNPTKLMDLIKTVGTKLEDKIKSGEIKESELMAEASEMINKMKDMPGLGNIQSMLNKMGMGLGGKSGKMNLGAMKANLDANMRKAKMKERMKAKAEANKVEPTVFSAGEKAEKTPRGTKPVEIPSQTPVNVDTKKKKSKAKK